MQNDAMASFQMKEYKIIKLYLDNPLADFSEECTNLLYIAGYKTTYENDEWVGFIHLGFKLESAEPQDEGEGTAKLLYEAVIAGSFAEKGPDSPEAKTAFERKLKLNGATTLIPLLRAALASAGALMGFPDSYKIPNINVFGLKWTSGAE